MSELSPTPTVDSSRPVNFRPTSMIEALESCEGIRTGFNFYGYRGDLLVALSYDELRRRSLDMAHRLMGLGLDPGSPCCIVAETCADTVIAFAACQYAGIVPANLPAKMNLGGGSAWRKIIATMIDAVSPSLVLCADDRIEGFEDVLRDLRSKPPLLLSHRALAACPTAPTAALRPFGVDDPAHIQFSSGSSGSPKGLLISQRALFENIRLMCDHFEVGEGKYEDVDRIASWLPFYHDMGWVGSLLAQLSCHLSVDYIDNAHFTRRPLLWLKLISDRRATGTYSPMLGYLLALKKAKKGVDFDLDLSSLRFMGIGADMIHPATMNEFAETFAPYGLDRRVLSPSYGMAEATLAVSLTPLNAGLSVDRIDEKDAATTADDAAEKGSHGGEGESHDGDDRLFARCGSVLPGFEVSIRNERGAPLAEGQCGRIFLRSRSMADGAYQEGVFSPLERDADGFFDTGDLGVLRGDELTVTGRAKEMILYNGRNIQPQTLDMAVKETCGDDIVNVGCFGVTDRRSGGDEVVAVVEITLKVDRASLKKRIAAALYRHGGVRATIFFAAPRTLKWTSSGKLRRLELRQAYLDDAVAPAPSSSMAA